MVLAFKIQTSHLGKRRENSSVTLSVSVCPHWLSISRPLQSLLGFTHPHRALLSWTESSFNENLSHTLLSVMISSGGKMAPVFGVHWLHTCVSKAGQWEAKRNSLFYWEAQHGPGVPLPRWQSKSSIGWEAWSSVSPLWLTPSLTPSSQCMGGFHAVWKGHEFRASHPAAGFPAIHM